MSDFSIGLSASARTDAESQVAAAAIFDGRPVAGVLVAVVLGLW